MYIICVKNRLKGGAKKVPLEKQMPCNLILLFLIFSAAVERKINFDNYCLSCIKVYKIYFNYFNI